MSDGDMARETVGPDSHRDPEAWCSERGHYRPERPRPGVSDGDITGPNDRSLVFPDGDITGQNGRGLVLTEGAITGPTGRGLVFRTGTLQARTAEAWCSRTGTLQDRTAEAWCSRKGTLQARAAKTWCPRTGTLQAQIPSTASDGLAPSAFDPSLEYSTDNVVLFWQPRPIFRSRRLRRLSSTTCHIIARSSL